MPMVKLAAILKPSAAIIWKKPNRANMPMIQMPRDNSEVLGFMIMHQAFLGLPRYAVWIQRPGSR